MALYLMDSSIYTVLIKSRSHDMLKVVAYYCTSLAMPESMQYNYCHMNTDTTDILMDKVDMHSGQV